MDDELKMLQRDDTKQIGGDGIDIIKNPNVTPDNFKAVLDSQKFMSIMQQAQQANKNGDTKVTKAEVYNVFMFGSRVGFIDVNFTVLDTCRKVKKKGAMVHPKLPGYVFVRGGAVACLLVIETEDEKLWTILCEQWRTPAMRRVLEIPAGMLDESNCLSGTMAAEIKEEVDIDIEIGANDQLGEPIIPSIGGCDETITLYAKHVEMKDADLDEIRGRITGVEKEGEHITLRVVPLTHAAMSATGDVKAICAFERYVAMRLTAAKTNKERADLVNKFYL